MSVFWNEHFYLTVYIVFAFPLLMFNRTKWPKTILKRWPLKKILIAFLFQLIHYFFYMKRGRQQAIVKTKGSDDGRNSVLSLLARSSSPIRSMIRNRSRRSASVPETSANKNTTVEVHPTHVSNQPPRLSTNQRLLIMLLMSLTSPYFMMVPNKDYLQSDDQEIYYSWNI